MDKHEDFNLHFVIIVSYSVVVLSFIAIQFHN
jgi:hypothetical protein